ncbi:MAG TPA: response regulator [Caulobacteraceae bacterium]|nr:response regulator [Caulobacteraceae bacterium]
MSESLDNRDDLVSDRQPGVSESVKPNVLIVDDEPASRSICADYCDLFDHASYAVRSGGEAVAALRRERFDVVVMSVHMAGALDAVRAIRSLPPPAAEAPIIGLTDVGKGDEAQRWMAAGLAAVLAKPITARRLFQALNVATESAATGVRSWAPA